MKRQDPIGALAATMVGRPARVRGSRALGLTTSPALLSQVDEVIE